MAAIKQDTSLISQTIAVECYAVFLNSYFSYVTFTIECIEANNGDIG